MEVFGLPQTISKIADLLQQLSEAGQKRRVRSILTKFLKAYVKLGDVSDSADNIINHLRMFSNYHPDSLAKQCEILKEQLSREIVYLDDAHSALRELFFCIIFLDENSDDAYWKLLESNGIDTQRWIVSVMKSGISRDDIVKVEKNKKNQLPTIEFPIIKKRTDKQVTLYKIDFNDKLFAPKLNKVLDKYEKRPSIELVREGRKKIKKIIVKYWGSTDILDALSTLKKESPGEPLSIRRG
ncbi:MAG: hypothetical protein HZB50_05770 [Chloroflexi bacterium]|nr:hypothetical protein [Chloroflexota bacterium]